MHCFGVFFPFVGIKLTACFREPYAPREPRRRRVFFFFLSRIRQYLRETAVGADRFSSVRDAIFCFFFFYFRDFAFQRSDRRAQPSRPRIRVSRHPGRFFCFRSVQEHNCVLHLPDVRIFDPISANKNIRVRSDESENTGSELRTESYRHQVFTLTQLRWVEKRFVACQLFKSVIKRECTIIIIDYYLTDEMFTRPVTRKTEPKRIVLKRSCALNV